MVGKWNVKGKRKNSPHNCPAIIYSAAACCRQGLRCSKRKEDFLCPIHCREQISIQGFLSRIVFHTAPPDLPNVQFTNVGEGCKSNRNPQSGNFGYLQI